MNSHVETLSISKILIQAAHIQRRHFAALSAAFVAMCSLMPSAERIRSGDSGLFVLAFLLLIPLAYLTATSVAVAAQSGQVVEFRRALQDGVRLYWANLTVGFFMVICLVPAFILFVIPAIYLMINWLVVAAVIVAEQTRGFAALQRSRALVRGYFWRTFGLFALAVAIQTVVQVVNSLVVRIPGVGTPSAWLLSGCAHAYSAALYVVLYFDLRARHEGHGFLQQPVVETAHRSTDEFAGTAG